MISPELLKGSLKTIVLKVLEENGRMYGYEITRKVEDLTRGKIVLTYGALYPVLHKLEAEGVLITESENYNNRIRIYYMLTPKGKSVVKEKLEELAEYIETLKTIVDLQPGLNHA
jgi:PadR family transcriptional regulator, regulatory protein PadR